MSLTSDTPFVEDVAATISSSIGLPRPNMTIAKQVISYCQQNKNNIKNAVDAIQNNVIFIADDILREVHESVQVKLGVPVKKQVNDRLQSSKTNISKSNYERKDRRSKEREDKNDQSHRGDTFFGYRDHYKDSRSYRSRKEERYDEGQNRNERNASRYNFHSDNRRSKRYDLSRGDEIRHKGSDRDEYRNYIDKEESERYRDYERKRLHVDEDRLNRDRRSRRERDRPVEDRDGYKSNNRNYSDRIPEERLAYGARAKHSKNRHYEDENRGGWNKSALERDGKKSTHSSRKRRISSFVEDNENVEADLEKSISDHNAGEKIEFSKKHSVHNQTRLSRFDEESDTEERGRNRTIDRKNKNYEELEHDNKESPSLRDRRSTDIYRYRSRYDTNNPYEDARTSSIVEHDAPNHRYTYSHTGDRKIYPSRDYRKSSATPLPSQNYYNDRSRGYGQKEKSSISNGHRSTSISSSSDREEGRASLQTLDRRSKEYMDELRVEGEGFGSLLRSEDDDHGVFIGDPKKFSKQETLGIENLLKLKEPGLKGSRTRRDQFQLDQSKWVNDRMRAAGMSIEDQDDDHFNNDDIKIKLRINRQVPSFLDGSQTFSKQQEIISVVTDPTCDMATLAKKGSSTYRNWQENNDRRKTQERYWEINNTKIGKLMGVKNEVENEEGTENNGNDEEFDYKKSSMYSKYEKENGRESKEKEEAQSTFSKTKSIKEQREFLPIFTVRDELLQVIAENQIIIIVGETGSGKTTQLTQFLHEAGFSNDGVIGCTQPRQLAAYSVAKRVATEMNVVLGEEVGYAIRFDKVTSDKTLIKYMTEGILLRETLRQPELDTYSAIIMDEAHERSLDTDILFGILKKIATYRRDLKIIVTSATLNANRFSDFFGDAPIFEIPGRTFPVDVITTKGPTEDYVEEAVKRAVDIHINNDEGDILIFMTGKGDIDATCDLIAQRLNQIGENITPLSIHPLHSQLDAEDQQVTFKKKDIRKCIVSTNIAETSITLDGIKYVIDCGYSKLSVYNPKVGMNSIFSPAL